MGVFRAIMVPGSYGNFPGSSVGLSEVHSMGRSERFVKILRNTSKTKKLFFRWTGNILEFEQIFLDGFVKNPFTCLKVLFEEKR